MRKGIVVDINQNIKSQNHGHDLNQLNRQNILSNERPAGSKAKEAEPSTPVQVGSARVNLSKEGLAAAAEFDFEAMDENLSKLTATGNSKGFANSHGAISYAKVKELLS